MRNPSPRIARWIMKLSSHKFTIIHRKGSLNVIADAMSRLDSGNTVQIANIDLNSFIPDAWYKDMLMKVRNNPQNFPDFRVQNNVLYKHITLKNKLLNDSSDWKIVVPTANRKQILSMFHDLPTSAHLGVFKTLARISQLYYWPHMKNSVVKFVRKCVICATCKTDNLPQAGLMGNYRNIKHPFQLISADLLGPYPRSRLGNQYVLVVTDWFTKSLTSSNF